MIVKEHNHPKVFYWKMLNISLHLRRRKQQVFTFACTAALMTAPLMLKVWYECCTVDDLGWIISPAVFLVEMFTGLRFYFSAGEGFVSANGLICINKSCSGFNYLLILLWLSFFLAARVHYTRFFKTILFFIPAAYLTAIAANGLRITLSIILEPLRIALPFSRDAFHWFHLAVGMGIFFIVLLTYYRIGNGYISHTKGEKNDKPR